MNKTFLPCIEACDNFNLRTSRDAQTLVPFLLEQESTIPIGFLHPAVVKELELDNQRHSTADDGSRPWHFAQLARATSNSSTGYSYVSFAKHINTFGSRTATMKSLCDRWRQEGFASNVIGGRLWRDELFAVYSHPFKDNIPEKAAFVMERVCCALFGLVTYGCHMTAYTKPDKEGEELKIWVPKRAETKQTWPGYLDNTVAGGIPYGLTSLESLYKECMEEASLDIAVAQEVTCTGSVTYFFQTKFGWLQPEVQYVYDLCLPDPNQPSSSLSPDEKAKVTPKPSDDEVASFQLLPLSLVIQAMHEGRFKPNCALVLVDFLIRHGYITPENEPNFLEIQTRLHGRFGFDTYVVGRTQ